MRARRVAFFGLMAVMLLLLWYTGDALYFWIVMFELALLGIAGVNLAATLFGMKIHQTLEPPKCDKGGVSTLRFTVANETVLPFAHLTLVYETMETVFHGGAARVSVTLLPRRSATVSHQVPCHYRGVYHLGFKGLEVTDLFGLIHLRLGAEHFGYITPAELLVYPRAGGLTPGAFLTDMDDAATAARVRRNEDLSSVEDLHVFRPGDPLKRAHWKLSARQNALIIKEFEGAVSSDHAVFVDCSAHAFEGEEAAALEDTICECAATFCFNLTARFEKVRLLTISDGRQELRGSGPDDYAAMRELLARVKFQGLFNIAEALGEERVSSAKIQSLALITRNPTELLFEQLIALSEEGCRITLVIAVTDVNFDERMVKMLGEFAMRGIDAITIFPGEEAAKRLGVSE
ncbi:DUF58 domain-containing protein [Oscillospiraceae bacterium OttesenSCG-928-F05]|nr:DUF58 domain-containing protein [Oscillospiraceae bacterium OttesenSCG-928-F05]